jgi:hypothetical protein
MEVWMREEGSLCRVKKLHASIFHLQAFLIFQSIDRKTCQPMIATVISLEK